MSSNLIKKFGKPALAIFRKVKYFFLDSYDTLLGLRDELTPPRSKIFIGNGDFKKTGDEFLKYFIEIGCVRPTDRILDIGCGLGRMAAPFTKYLSSEGVYEGIDIVPDGIQWCSKKITPKYPNFHFQIADVYSKRYYPKGKYKSSEYKFPYEDNSFDFIFLTSVFTHMLPKDMENYLAEISRLLKKGGKCFITYFLLNKNAQEHIEKNKSTFSFKYSYETCKVEDKEMPEGALAYEEDFIKELYKKYSIEILSPIHYGSWCGRQQYLSFQDIVLGSKK